MGKKKNIYKVILEELEKLRKEFARSINGHTEQHGLKIEEKIIYLCDILKKSEPYYNDNIFKADLLKFSELAKTTFPNKMYEINIIPIINNILSDF